MSTIDGTEGIRTSWSELPAVVTTYLTSRQNRGISTAITTFASDAVVTDDGHTYRGRHEIGKWLDRVDSEFTVTSEITGVTMVDPSRVVVVQHLEGDFPGGVVDLQFRFTLAGASIVQLVIEPCTAC